MRKALIAAVVFQASTAFSQATPAGPPSCEHLAQLVVTSIKITSAYPVAAGAFVPPSTTPLSPDQLKFYKDLPAFCRVVAQGRPSPDSDIKIEVWLPLTDWNGKFQAPGNGGFAGSMPYRALGAAIKHGYATAGTDTGHSTEGAEWALGHREKVVDFGYRAVHQMTQFGKATAKAFYGRDPRYSYFVACSNGGREALMEAQRYPEDYNGILAGAPANYYTHLMAFALWGCRPCRIRPASSRPSCRPLPRPCSPPATNRMASPTVFSTTPGNATSIPRHWRAKHRQTGLTASRRRKSRPDC